jgi:hypothetical protein
MILAVIPVGGVRSAEAVGEGVPKRDLVRVQGQAARTASRGSSPAASPAATTDVACSAKPGAGPAKNRKNPTAGSATPQRVTSASATRPQDPPHSSRLASIASATPLQVPNSALHARYAE